MHSVSDKGQEGLFREAQEARQKAEQAEKRASFLAEVSTVLASSLDLRTTLAFSVTLAIPLLADWCIMDLLEEDGSFRRLGAHRDSRNSELLKLLERFTSNLESDSCIGRVFKLAQPIIVSNVEASMANGTPLSSAEPEFLGLVRRLGMCSYMSVPLRVQGRVVGVVTFVSSSDPDRYGQPELELAEEIAWRTALAIEHARLYERSQLAIRARDDLLAIVSHDLRNPLSAIYMNSRLILHALQTLEREPSAHKIELMKRQAALIQLATQQMHHLIRDLLDQAKIEAGHLRVERSECDLVSCINEVLDMLHPLAAQKSIRLERPELKEPISVICDRERILQVFSNIIGNAIKFTSSGGTVSVLVDPADTEQLRIAVKDTGPGIPAEHLPHVFDRYWQPRFAARQGSGLGLAIAKGIIDAHGGKLWVESKMGAGSTFYFTLGRANEGTEQGEELRVGSIAG